MVKAIGVLMLRGGLSGVRTRHRITKSVLRNDFVLLLLLLLRLLRFLLLWLLLLQRFSVRNRINRAESSYERSLFMFVRPVIVTMPRVIVPMTVMPVVVVVTVMMMVMTVRQ